jgi:hypothetical protein
MRSTPDLTRRRGERQLKRTRSGAARKDIAAALGDAGYVAAISGDVERETRTRLGGATRRACAELLERYFESKGRSRPQLISARERQKKNYNR